MKRIGAASVEKDGAGENSVLAQELLPHVPNLNWRLAAAACTRFREAAATNQWETQL